MICFFGGQLGWEGSQQKVLGKLQRPLARCLQSLRQVQQATAVFCCNITRGNSTCLPFRQSSNLVRLAHKLSGSR